MVALGEAVGLDPAAVATGLAGCASVPGADGADRGRPAVRGRRRLRPQPGLAPGRARPARAGRGGPWRRAHRGVRLGRRARHGQAPAHGPDRGRASPAGGRDRRGPARRGPRRDPRCHRARRRGGRQARDHDLLLIPDRASRHRGRASSAPGPATSCCSPARATSARSSVRTARAPWDERTVAEASPSASSGSAEHRCYPCRPWPRPRHARRPRTKPAPRDAGPRGRRAPRRAPTRPAEPGRPAIPISKRSARRCWRRSPSTTPTRTSDRVDAGVRPRRRGPRRPAARDRRAVRHPSDRLGPDPRRARRRPGRDPGRAPPRRPRGHRVQPDRRRGALRRRGRPARRRRHEALEVQHPQPRAAAGREHPQDAPGDGPGHPGRAHQARRPAPQHAHAVRPAVGQAAAHRPPDDGDLRAAGRAARHLADQVGARGPRVQGARAGAVPRARHAPRHPAQGAARPTSSARSPSFDPSSRRPASTPT